MWTAVTGYVRALQSYSYHKKKTHHSNTGTPGGVQPFVRLKGPNEYVSDYQAYVMVGGGNMWMTLESGVATSWVRSVRAL